MDRLVDVILNEWKDEGVYNINFSTKHLNSGIYYSRIIIGDRIITKRFEIVK